MGAASDTEQRFADLLQVAKAAKSTGLIVRQKGRTLIDTYWPLAEPSAALQAMTAAPAPDGAVREDVASAQKSVVAFLVGVAITQGAMSLDAPMTDYLGPGWSRAPRDREAAITLRHAMSMTTGLSTVLDYEQPAGTRWEYNTNAYATVSRAVARAMGRDLGELTQRWLTGPAEMMDSRWERRAWVQAGQDANAFGFISSARDLARFGEVVMAGGRWRDRVLLDNPDYFKAMLTPSQALNRGYGLLWWVGAPPNAPRDTVSARGALGRYCLITPSIGLIVSRIGDEPPQGGDVLADLYAALMPALGA
ncbi:MAG: serine hydrolase domain-containing protein [Hyphomonadaceae bacterium]